MAEGGGSSPLGTCLRFLCCLYLCSAATSVLTGGISAPVGEEGGPHSSTMHAGGAGAGQGELPLLSCNSMARGEE
jgi:hypothetical protein